MSTFEFPEMPAPGSAVSANWGRKVVKCLRQLTPIAGRGMTFTRTPNGTVYNSTPGSKAVGIQTSELKPFTIRWFSKGDGDDGEWQIYIPLTAVKLRMRNVEANSYPCICVNDKATDGKGEEIYQWYKIEDIETSEGEVRTIGDITYQSIPVYLLLKPYPRFKVSADPNAYGGVLHKEIVGSMNVAQYTIDGKTITSRLGLRSANDTVDVADTPTDYRFNVVYKFEEGEMYDPSAEAKTVIVDMEFSGGRTVYSSEEEEVDVTSWEEVWLKVAHDTEKGEEMKISLVEKEDETNDKQTLIQLYKLKDGVVVSDKRTNLDKVLYYEY